jgi:hypothetical protein
MRTKAASFGTKAKSWHNFAFCARSSTAAFDDSGRVHQGYTYYFILACCQTYCTHATKQQCQQTRGRLSQRIKSANNRDLFVFEATYNPNNYRSLSSFIMDDQSTPNADPGKGQAEQPALMEPDAPNVPAAARSTRRRRKK